MIKLKSKNIPRFDLVVIGHVSYDENKTKYGVKIVPSGAGYLVTLPASLYSKNIGLVTRIGGDFDIKMKWQDWSYSGNTGPYINDAVHMGFQVYPYNSTPDDNLFYIYVRIFFIYPSYSRV